MNTNKHVINKSDDVIVDILSICEILNNIVFNLCYIDLLALNETCKIIYKNIDKIYFKADYIIKRYMDHHNLKYENYIARVKEDCVIFGGFIFNVIFDIYDPVSDIDVLHYKYEDNIYKTCSKVIITKGKYNTYVQEYNECDKMINNKDGTGWFCYPLNLIATDGSSSDNILYQHVTLLTNSESISKYLDTHCDLDITKNYCYNNKIYIKNLNNMFLRVEYADIMKCFIKTFRFYNWIFKWSLCEYYRLYDRCLERITKYTNRGINIIVDKQLNSTEYLRKLINNYNLQYNLVCPVEKLFAYRNDDATENIIKKLKDIIYKYDLECECRTKGITKSLITLQNNMDEIFINENPQIQGTGIKTARKRSRGIFVNNTDIITVNKDIKNLFA
jgi:hypothetical protein